MHCGQHYCMRVTPVHLVSVGRGDVLSNALLRRWRELRAAPPAAATAAAVDLTQETLAHLEVTAPISTPAASPSSPNTALHTSVSTMLTPPVNAQLIWSALRRQRVPWQTALQLLPWQLQAMSPVQQTFVTRRVAVAPWEVANVVLTAADVVDDAALVQQYGAMKRAAHMVELARLITAALRERPDLPGGLLPVSYGVLLHAYTLGGRTPAEAAMTLGVTKHVRLLGRSALSRAAEERLVLGHAAVEGRQGDWAAALAVVGRSRAVRLSARRGWERYVHTLQQQQPKGEDGARLSGVASSRGSDKRVHTSLPDSAWAVALTTFVQQPPEQQSFAEARAVLAAVPLQRTQQPDYVLLAAAVLRQAARRSYAGTLTRRLVSHTKRADWMFALSLAIAARSYDVAVPLLPLVPADTKVPEELLEFCQVVEESGKGKAVGEPPLTRATAAALSYPQALAHALEGTAATREMLLSCCPHTQPLSPLRSLLLASRRASADSNDNDDTTEDEIDCSTFQSSALTQQVCAAASAKRQRYFYKVLPASMCRHHFTHSPVDGRPLVNVVVDGPTPQLTVQRGATEDAIAACQERLQAWRWQTATTPAACTAALSDLSAFLRATHAVEGEHTTGPFAKPRLTEEMYMRCVATLMAWGAVQLPATERFHWPLAVLKAAWLLRVTVDASCVVSTARSIPSTFLDHAALAVPSVLVAHTLLGQWQAGLQMCARLTRRAQEGSLRLEIDREEGKPHTVKHTPPAPSLKEAMALVGYAAPTSTALLHWTALDAAATADGVLPLLLIELKRDKDVRHLCELLQETVTPGASQRHKAALQTLARRRMLLGAAFTLLNEESVLRHVVHAAGQEHVRSEDLDGHGLQRLLGVLPPTAVCNVLAAEVASGRCAHEHWLLACVSQPTVALAEVRTLTQLRPTSTALSAVCCARTALENTNPALCLKALRRVVEHALDGFPARDVLLLCVAHVLRRFLADDALLQRCVQKPPTLVRGDDDVDGGDGVISTIATVSSAAAEDEARQTLHQAQLLYNRMQEVHPLSESLKHTRPVVRASVDQPRCVSAFGPSSCAAWVVLTVLHTVTSRWLHLPIPAPFSSHLLRSAVATDASDWQAALVFFNALRHPTTDERVALVRSLRHCGATATSLLLRHRRFMRGLPEQVVIWADEAAGSSKWARSMALLTASIAVEGSTERAVTARTGEGAKGGAEEGGPLSQPQSTSPLSPVVAAVMSKWNADECLRAAQLLRRQGFLHIPNQPERSLQRVRVLETEPFARRQVEAMVEVLHRGVSQAAAAPPGSVAAAPLPPSQRGTTAQGDSVTLKPTLPHPLPRPRKE